MPTPGEERAAAYDAANELYDRLLRSRSPAQDIAMMQAALTQARAEGFRAGLEEGAKLIPTTWLDPLLSGQEKVLPGYGPWGGPSIEALMRALMDRLRRRAQEPE